jgi:hypothetical protein
MALATFLRGPAFNERYSSEAAATIEPTAPTRPMSWFQPPFKVEELFPPEHDPESHPLTLSIALILLGNGLTEEAHSLVSPPMKGPWMNIHQFYTKVFPTAKSLVTCGRLAVCSQTRSISMGKFEMMG